MPAETMRACTLCSKKSDASYIEITITATFLEHSVFLFRRDSLAVPLINCATSFYAGLAVFAVLGYIAQQKGVEVAHVAASGKLQACTSSDIAHCSTLLRLCNCRSHRLPLIMLTALH